MCGIAGVFAYREPAAPVDRHLLLRVRDAMVQRGPDGAGIWVSADQRLGLAHRRLSVIDLSDAATQPMEDDSGRLCIVFNGEIYNYQALRRELVSKGYQFRSTSDTEVVLHAYRAFGEQVFGRLRGMFALAIWDEEKRGLLLARDPFGIKPLYYADDGSTFWVASQVKALTRTAAVRVDPDAAAYAGYFLWGYVPDPHTIYRQVRAVPAGASVWVDRHGARTPQAFTSVTDLFLEAEQQAIDLPPTALRERVRAGVVDSVRAHLIADVPVGVFLSAGRDSSTLVALASETVPSVKTITLGFEEYRGRPEDEVPVAEAVARRYGTQHQTVWISSDEFADEFDAILTSMDQPSIDGVNSYLVCKAAKAAGLKVALSGLGGDELFGGYPSYRQLPAATRMLQRTKALPGLGRAFRASSAWWFRKMGYPKYAGLFEYGTDYPSAYLLRRALYMPWELDRFMHHEVVSLALDELQTTANLTRTIQGIRSSRLKVGALEMSWYMRGQLLRDVDWASMAHSVEVRVPFVDVELTRRVAPLIASRRAPTKRDLCKIPVNPLPPAVINRRKTGFSTPIRSWLLSEARARGEPGLRPWSARVIARWQDSEPVKKIFADRSVLVFRIGQLGDALVSIPAIAAVRAQHPAQRIVLLSDAQGSGDRVAARDVLGPLGWFEETLQYSYAGSAWQRLTGLIALVRAIRRLRPQYVYDLSPQRSVWQAWRDEFFFRRLAETDNYFGSRAWAKPERLWGGSLATVTPEWLRLVRVVRPASRGYRPPSVNLPVRPDVIRARLRATGLGERPQFIALAPGSKMPAKRWPLENFAELGRRLLCGHPELRIVVVGGIADRGLGDTLCASIGAGVHNFAGALTLFESAALLAEGLCYVGNDTGTMHLAALAGTPCVALFSARDYPGKWDPAGSRHVVLRRDVPCAGCMLEICVDHGNRCLRLITVEDACVAVENVLSSTIAATSVAA